MPTCATPTTARAATSLLDRANANILVRVRPTTHALLQRLCLAEDRTVAGMVDRALKEYAKNHEAELEQLAAVK